MKHYGGLESNPKTNNSNLGFLYPDPDLGFF